MRKERCMTIKGSDVGECVNERRMMMERLMMLLQSYYPAIFW